MPNEQLIAHIRTEFARGTDRTTVIHSLITAGWKVEDINTAIGIINSGTNTNNPPAPAAAPAPVPRRAVVMNASQATSPKIMIENGAAGLFIACIVVLTAVSVLGVWDFFSTDVITKSFETLGLLAFVAVIVIIASKYVGDPSDMEESTPNPAYRAIRNITLGTLIASSSLLALLGVLAIWNVITDNSVLNKSLSSLGIIAFSSLIVVMVCLDREKNPMWKKRSGEMTGGAIFAGLILLWILVTFIR